MPIRPPRACQIPRCPGLTTGRYCNAHIQRGANAARVHTPDAKRFYGSAQWQRIRRVVRMAQPICQRCKSRRSASVHHKDNDIRNNTFDPACPERSNLEALCTPCHDEISARSHRAKQA